MKKIVLVTVGGAVSLALTLGLTGVAAAAPVTTTTGPSGTAPATTAPATTTPAKPKALTGRQIWFIVKPRHVIDCAHVTQQLKRIRAADAAAAKRLGRWQIKQSTDQKSQSKNAANRTKVSSGRVKGFQKLENDGQALIRRIDAKCSVTSPAT